MPARAGTRPAHAWRPALNGFTLLILIVLALGVPLAFRAGMLRERRDARVRGAGRLGTATRPAEDATTAAAAEAATPPGAEHVAPTAAATAFHAGAAPGSAEAVQLRAFADDRARLFRELADARTELARFREIVVDLEDNAPPPLLDLPNAPDDLKLIVGVGPVLERMLQRLGITSYRQIARWSEHDIDTIDARLDEFHGRIRRDGWVTQARALHQGKYGEKP